MCVVAKCNDTRFRKNKTKDEIRINVYRDPSWRVVKSRVDAWREVGGRGIIVSRKEVKAV